MKDLKELQPLALAFLGDAIHTAFVREEVLCGNINTINNYHNLSKKFCNAQKQADALDRLMPHLSEEEQDIARKGRNAKAKHTAKNFDIETYKKATSFEALIGYLYLTKNQERLEFCLKKSIEE